MSYRPKWIGGCGCWEGWGGQSAHHRHLCRRLGRKQGEVGELQGKAWASWAPFPVSSSPAGHRSGTRVWVEGSGTGCSLSPVPLSCFNWQVPIHRGRQGGQGLARDHAASPRHQPGRPSRGQIPCFLLGLWVQSLRSANQALLLLGPHPSPGLWSNFCEPPPLSPAPPARAISGSHN